MKITRRPSVSGLLLSGLMSGSVIGCVDDKESDSDTDTDTAVIVDSGVVGNLMAPPEIELCIDVSPDNAVINVTSAIDGDGGMSDNDCEMIYGGMMVTISATAEGYEDFETEQEFDEDTEYTIVMDPISNSDGSYTDGLSTTSSENLPHSQPKK